MAERTILRDLLTAHERLTGSRVARAILRSDRALSHFWRVAPVMPTVDAAAPIDLKAVNE